MFNTLLQILEDGRLTHAPARSVDFEHSAGHDLEPGHGRPPQVDMGFAKTSEAVTYERMKAKVDEALKATSGPSSSTGSTR